MMKSMYQTPQTAVVGLVAARILLASGESASLIGNVEDKHPIHHRHGD